MNYRQPPPAAPDSEVRFRFLDGVWAGLVVLVCAVFVVGGMLGCVVALRRVTVTCVRGGDPPDACVITRAYPLVGAENQVLPLSTIHGTRLTAVKQKNGYVYDLAFDTDGGAIVQISGVHGGQAMRAQQEEQIRAFLREPKTQYLTVEYDAPSPSGVAFSLSFAIMPLFMLFFLLQRATVTFAWAARQIVLTRTRWPLRTFTRRFALDEVQSATMQDKRGSKGATLYQVALVLADGELVPLLNAWSSGQKSKLRAMAAINEQLARRDAEVRGGVT